MSSMENSASQKQTDNVSLAHYKAACDMIDNLRTTLARLQGICKSAPADTLDIQKVHRSSVVRGFVEAIMSRTERLLFRLLMIGNPELTGAPNGEETTNAESNGDS